MEKSYRYWMVGEIEYLKDNYPSLDIKILDILSNE